MQENPIELSEGTIAPDFAMRDKQGKTYNLSDLHGKRDVVATSIPKTSLLVAL
jgi:peroxiredoxin